MVPHLQDLNDSESEDNDVDQTPAVGAALALSALPLSQALGPSPTAPLPAAASIGATSPAVDAFLREVKQQVDCAFDSSQEGAGSSRDHAAIMSWQQDGKKRKRGAVGRCVCTASGCLLAYCVCFASGDTCAESCECTGCGNDESTEERKQRRERALQKRASKIRKAPLHHRKEACTCSRTGCRKGYCICWKGGVGCTAACTCVCCCNMWGVRPVTAAQTAPMASGEPVAAAPTTSSGAVAAAESASGGTAGAAAQPLDHAATVRSDDDEVEVEVDSEVVEVEVEVVEVEAEVVAEAEAERMEVEEVVYAAQAVVMAETALLAPTRHDVDTAARHQAGASRQAAERREATAAEERQLEDAAKEVADSNIDESSRKLSELRQLLKCALCGGVLQEPHTVTTCQHSFCYTCLRTLFERCHGESVAAQTEKRCPHGCQAPVRWCDLARNEQLANLVAVLES